MRGEGRDGGSLGIRGRNRNPREALGKEPAKITNPNKTQAVKTKPAAPAAPVNNVPAPSSTVSLSRPASPTSQPATYADPRKASTPSWGQVLNQNVNSWGKNVIENLDNTAVAALRSGDQTTAMAAAAVRAPAESFISGVKSITGTASLLDGSVRQQTWDGIKAVANNPGQVVDAAKQYLGSHSIGEIAADAYAEIGGAMIGGGIAKAASAPVRGMVQEAKYGYATLERQVSYGHVPTTQGKVFQNTVADSLRASLPADNKVVQELHVRGYTDATQTKLAPGYTKIDATVLDSQNKVISLNEVKLRDSTSLTSQQKIHQPKLAANGGTIVGPKETLKELEIEKGHPINPTTVNRLNGPSVPRAVRPGMTPVSGKTAAVAGAVNQAAGGTVSREVVSNSGSKNYVTNDGRMVGKHTSYTRAEAQNRQAAREREEAAQRETSRANHERAFSRSEAKDTTSRAADKAAAERSAANHERAFSRSEARDTAARASDRAERETADKAAAERSAANHDRAFSRSEARDTTAKAADKAAANESRTSESRDRSGGGRDRVICTHFYQQGRLSAALWRADLDFTRRHLSTRTVRGYHAWAIPYVRLMRHSRLAERLMYPLARWRAEELAYQMGVLPQGSIKGKLVRLLLEPLNWLLGALVSEQDWESLWNERQEKQA